MDKGTKWLDDNSKHYPSKEYLKDFQPDDELIERVVGQQIAYYAIDEKPTDFHPLYGEAIEKTFLPPIRVHALIEWNEYASEFMQSGAVDQNYAITIHFHHRRLTEDQDLYVRVGDFVLYGEVYYEIVQTAEPRKIYGQGDHSVEVSAKCIRARSGVFDGR